MKIPLGVHIYRWMIDPLLSRLYSDVMVNINPGDKVLDVACGTGSMAIAMASKAGSVTGIDIDAGGINSAIRVAGKRHIDNVSFLVQDAGVMTSFIDNQFDIAMISLAVHQFDPEVAAHILSEMKRIACRVIIIDYNHDLPNSLPGMVARGAERLAGGDHYRNFRLYMQNGGLDFYLSNAGLARKSEKVRGSGVFVITVTGRE